MLRVLMNIQNNQTIHILVARLLNNTQLSKILAVYHKTNYIFSFDLTTSLLVISQMKIKTCFCIKASPWKLTAGLLTLPKPGARKKPHKED